MYCKACGKLIRDYASFCNYCGVIQKVSQFESNDDNDEKEDDNQEPIFISDDQLLIVKIKKYIISNHLLLLIIILLIIVIFQHFNIIHKINNIDTDPCYYLQHDINQIKDRLGI